MTKERMVKVVFPIGEEKPETLSAERLWAREIGVNEFEIMNTPFFTYGISNGDIVEAFESSTEGLFAFSRILQKSGWKTIRVLTGDYLPKESTPDVLTQLLKTMNCTGYESGFNTILAVDVPPDLNPIQLGQVLDQHGYKFEYADPVYDELFPN